MEFVREVAIRGLALWNGLTLLEKIIVGAVGALLAYLILALQLLFCIDMRALSDRLMSSPPE
jgi:hypothetical protein